MSASMWVALLLATSDAPVDRLAPSGNGGFLVADDAHVAPHLGVSALLLASWAKDPVVLRGPDGAVVRAVVGQQWTTTAAASLGLFDRLELTVRAAGALADGRAKLTPALLDPRVSLKVLALEAGPFALAGRASVGGPADLTAEPALVASLALPAVKAGVDVGSAITARGIALTWAAAAAVPVGDVVSLSADLYGSAAPGHTPVEGALGAAAQVGPAQFFVGVGGGLVADVGTPRVRAFGGVRLAFDPNASSRASSIAPAASSPSLAPPTTSPPAAPAAPAHDPAASDAAPAADASSSSVSLTERGLELADDVVLFDTESDRLLASSSPTLREVARVLQAHPEIVHVIIEGHADARGDADYNRRLSLWRALNVKHFLVAAGVDAARLSVLASGRDKPRAPNDTPEGRRQNRRVELHVERSAP